jgi:hypothetical protein
MGRRLFLKGLDEFDGLKGLAAGAVENLVDLHGPLLVCAWPST